jgi:uncharacterized membrane protein
LLSGVEKFLFIVLGIVAVVEALLILALPLSLAAFWWLVAFNAVSTLGIFAGLPLWDGLRRRFG